MKITRNSELGTWNLVLGTWNLELITKHLLVGLIIDKGKGKEKDCKSNQYIFQHDFQAQGLGDNMMIYTPTDIKYCKSRKKKKLNPPITDK